MEKDRQDPITRADIENMSEGELQATLRPQRFEDYIGQRREVGNIKVFVEASRRRNDAMCHLLLSGPPGLGKCITADSLILTEDGLVPFRDLIPEGMTPESAVEAEIMVRGVNGLEPTSHVYASGRRATRRITTRSGFQLEGTLCHPVLVATAEGARWRPLGALTAGDAVAIARGTQLWGKTKKRAIWKSQKNHERQRRLENQTRALYRMLQETLKRPPSYAELCLAQTQGRSRCSTAGLTARRLDLALSPGALVKPADPDLWRRLPLQATPHGTTIELDADLAYLLGMLVGDGHFERGALAPAFVITCQEPEIQADLQAITARHFGRQARIAEYPPRSPLIRFSQTIGQLFIDLGTKPVTAAFKEVPSAILTSPREVVVGFLQGLFDADGHARKDGVELGSHAYELTRQVQLLLLNFGIVAHVHVKDVKGAPFWTLFVGGADAVTFHDEIGFRLSRKAAKRASLAETSRAWQRADLVPCANALLRAMLVKTGPHSRATHKFFSHVTANDRTPTRQQIERYLQALPESARDLPEFQMLEELRTPERFWSEVVSIEDGEADVFDFVVPGTHSFVANGLINHNTTLAQIVSREMGAELHVTSGPAIERKGDLAGILTSLGERDVLFIDEIHRLNAVVEENLYPAMEDFQFDIIVGDGPHARTLKLELPRFTLIGATTRAGLLTNPLRDRFGHVARLEYYEIDELETIVVRSSRLMRIPIDAGAAHEVARRSRGTPRIANRLLARLRDFAQVAGKDCVDMEITKRGLDQLGIDGFGFDYMDRKYLETLIDKFDGGPVGINTIAAAISEHGGTLEEVYEPYLLQQGFIHRTSRGRVASRLAYEHLGRAIEPGNRGGQSPLF